MKKAVLLIASLLVFNKGYSQEYSNEAFFASAGLGFTINLNADGFGLNFGLGYQKDIWRNRLRLVPSFTFGIYTNFGATDVRPATIKSSNLKINLNYDLLRIKTFSLFIGTGITGNYSSSKIRGDGTFRETHFAFNGLFGFRLNSVKKDVAYELKILDLTVEPTYQEEYVEAGVFQIRVIYKLNKS